MSAASTARPLGLLIMLLGAWGGILPYVGQRFGYRLDQAVAWRWTESHATLSLAPGAAAVTGGLLLLAGPAAGQRLGALLGLVAGAWFVLGPTLQPLWTTTSAAPAATGHLGSKTMRILEGIGYHYGTGLLIAALAGIALGLLALGAAACERDAGLSARATGCLGSRSDLRPLTKHPPAATTHAGRSSTSTATLARWRIG